MTKRERWAPTPASKRRMRHRRWTAYQWRTQAGKYGHPGGLLEWRHLLRIVWRGERGLKVLGVVVLAP